MANARRISAVALTIALVTAPAMHAQTYPSANDERNNLKPGLLDAAAAQRGMRLVSLTPKPSEFDSLRGLTSVNSDLAFGGNYVYQGNFAGFSIWEVASMDEAVEWLKRSPLRDTEVELRKVLDAEDFDESFAAEIAAAEERRRAEPTAKS